MRISDWSSDVCSSDLFGIGIGAGQLLLAEHAVDHAVADSAGGVRRAYALAIRHPVVTVDARPRDHRASAEREGAKTAQAIHAGSCWAAQKSASSKASVDSAPRTKIGGAHVRTQVTIARLTYSP